MVEKKKKDGITIDKPRFDLRSFIDVQLCLRTYQRACKHRFYRIDSPLKAV